MMSIFRETLRTIERYRLIKICLRTNHASHPAVLESRLDKHNGVLVDISQLDKKLTEERFNKILEASLSHWRQQGHSAVWLQIPITLGKFAAMAAEFGFSCHHTRDRELIMSIWLDATRANALPAYATHQIGVAGLVYREDTGEVLMVQDAGRSYDLWKFPGGVSNPGEDLGETAVREVWEETGIKAEFRSILAFRQQHDQPGAFGLSDIFFVCRMTPLTFAISRCTREIAKSRWMSLNEVFSETDVAPVTVRIAGLFRHGLTKGFDEIDIVGENMKSVYKGLMYKIYHRPHCATRSPVQHGHRYSR